MIKEANLNLQKLTRERDTVKIALSKLDYQLNSKDSALEATNSNLNSTKKSLAEMINERSELQNQLDKKTKDLQESFHQSEVVR
jgi:chromosome segregation ATPase